MLYEWFSYKWFTPEVLLEYHWASPEFLWAIPFIPLLFVLRRRLGKRRRQLIVVSEQPAAGFLHGLVWLRLLPPFLVWIALALILIALARPQIVITKVETVSEGVDIMLVIDISDSMNERDMPPSRLSVAKRVAKEFVSGRPNDRIGIVIFSGEALTLSPATMDYAMLVSYLDDLTPGMIPTAGTAIGSALGVAINRLRESTTRDKVAILLSDGDNNSGSLDPITTAGLANAYGIKIYSIAVGISKPVISNDSLNRQRAPIDESELRNIAAAAGGKFFHANNSGALTRIFDQIDLMEKAPSKELHTTRVEDRYRPYLYWALIFLGLALAAKNTFLTNALED